ncbi:hypothetical protein L0Z72_04200 [candidate division KSB1 bacterium]|nr:hypothetical protein [candidate division KSB1 bacterium]
MNSYEIKNSMLVNEFDSYIREHPEVAQHFPDNAMVVMLLAEDEEFSLWNRRNAQKMAEKNQPIVFINIKKLKPVRSRIEELAIETTN